MVSVNAKETKSITKTSFPKRNGSRLSKLAVTLRKRSSADENANKKVLIQTKKKMPSQKKRQMLKLMV
jgi:hypothetical protein